jgi:hypothetical protein
MLTLVLLLYIVLFIFSLISLLMLCQKNLRAIFACTESVPPPFITHNIPPRFPTFFSFVFVHNAWSAHVHDQFSARF